MKKYQDLTIPEEVQFDDLLQETVKHYYYECIEYVLNKTGKVTVPEIRYTNDASKGFGFVMRFQPSIIHINPALIHDNLYRLIRHGYSYEAAVSMIVGSVLTHEMIHTVQDHAMFDMESAYHLQWHEVEAKKYELLFIDEKEDLIIDVTNKLKAFNKGVVVAC